MFLKINCKYMLLETFSITVVLLMPEFLLLSITWEKRLIWLNFKHCIQTYQKSLALQTSLYFTVHVIMSTRSSQHRFCAVLWLAKIQAVHFYSWLSPF